MLFVVLFLVGLPVALCTALYGVRRIALTYPRLPAEDRTEALVAWHDRFNEVYDLADPEGTIHAALEAADATVMRDPGVHVQVNNNLNGRRERPQPQRPSPMYGSRWRSTARGLDKPLPRIKEDVPPVVMELLEELQITHERPADLEFWDADSQSFKRDPRDASPFSMPAMQEIGRP